MSKSNYKMQRIKTKIPVMSNSYYSNSIIVSKRAKITQPVPIIYKEGDPFNRFQVHPEQVKRLVSESYTATDRNYKSPVSNSPLMMTNGVSAIDIH
jgi:hypothetical protein